jgi:tetratricopeptide (TPR) repeat protein
MLIQESRTYQLAKAALLAVLLAVTPVTAVLRAQTKPLPTAEKQEDPLNVLYKAADKAFEEKKYKEALDLFQELEDKAGDVANSMKAVLSFRKATCLFFMKDWPKAQVELTTFLDKYPKGTEDFFDGDNRRGTAELILIEAFSKQGKWDQALARLEKIRTNALARPEERVSAFTLSAQIVVDRAKSSTDELKKAAYSQAISLLKQATAEGINTPERREAAYKLVEMYTKLGLTKEATQLKSEIDARSTGSPVEVVRSNFQRLEIGDARFAAAESAADEAFRGDFYRQALNNYQGTLRRVNLTRSFGKAIEAKQTEVEGMTKAAPKPNAEQADAIRRAQLDLEQFKKIEAEFKANKDYDAFISYRIGLCLLELKRPWEAHVAFLDIFENSPEFSRIAGAYYYHIVALRRIGRNTEAQTKCKEFIQKFPKDEMVSSIALILGDISQEREEFPEAIAHYKWVQANVANLTPEVAEEIDFRIAACLFSQVDWAPASKAFEAFLKKYERSSVRQQVLYMNALCSFFQGKYKETKIDFDKYQQEYPKGQFIPDVRYRQAIVKFGVNPPDIAGTIKLCEDWLKDYAKDRTDEVIAQTPEVYTLIGDANIRLADELDKKVKAADLRVNLKTPDRAKFAAIKDKLEKEKEAVTGKAIDAYEAAAKSARTNPQALEFVLGELRKLLPGRGEHKRMRDLFKEIFDWDHNDPKAMTYLYEVIRSTERMGDMPEFAQQAEKVRKDLSAKLADGRKAVDQLERKQGVTRPEIDTAKEAVKKLSAELEAELAKVEVKRQSSIAEQKKRALKILSDAVAESINDRKQEGTEKLIVFLAEKLARKIKRVKAGAKPEPGAYTSADAEKELTKLLRLDENRASLVAQARGFFALGQLAVFTREPEKTAANFAKIAANFKAEELNPTILALVGDSLLAKNETKKAEEYFRYILEFARSSEYADYGFAGLAEIRLGEKKYAEALSLCDEAIDNNILMSKELDLRFTRARALAELSKLDDAFKAFEEIIRTKEWRGEKTAASLYWLGQLHERNAGLMAAGKPSLITKPKSSTDATLVPKEMAGTSPISGAAPLTVKFSASAPAAGKVSYLWDFGEKGATSTEAAPSYAYAAAGEFTATLTIKVDGKEQSKTTVTINALANNEPENAKDAYNKSIAYYRRCHMTWKKYEVWAAKSYFGEAKILATKLEQKDAAKRLLQEMLEKDRIKDTREGVEAKAYLLGL